MSAMKGMPRPGAESIALFRSLVPSDPRVQVRPMFGNMSAFVDSQMFFGLFGDDLFVRLGETDRQALMAEGGSSLEPMPGRPMREYVILPHDWASDASRVGKWVQRSLDYAGSLPPKSSKRTSSK